MYTSLISPNPVATLDISITGMNGTACADTGAIRSTASECLYHTLLVKRTKFKKCKLTMTLADGIKSKMELS